MNFFSHYYFDRTEQASFNTGLILPDLLRNFLNVRLPVLDLNFGIETPENEILKGCLKHIERDGSFHQSEFFVQSNAQLIKMIKDNGFAEQLPRYWFLAHIMVELCLDAVLIERDVNLLHKFYNDLGETHKNPSLAKFISFLGEEKTEVFLSKFGRFLEARYLFSYTDSSRMAFALNMISKRAGIIGDYNPEQTEMVTQLSVLAKNLVQNNYFMLPAHHFE